MSMLLEGTSHEVRSCWCSETSIASVVASSWLARGGADHVVGSDDGSSRILLVKRANLGKILIDRHEVPCGADTCIRDNPCEASRPLDLNAHQEAHGLEGTDDAPSYGRRPPTDQAF